MSTKKTKIEEIEETCRRIEQITKNELKNMLADMYLRKSIDSLRFAYNSLLECGDKWAIEQWDKIMNYMIKRNQTSGESLHKQAKMGGEEKQ